MKNKLSIEQENDKDLILTDDDLKSIKEAEKDLEQGKTEVL